MQTRQMSQVDDLLLNVYKLEALRQLALGNQTFPVPGEPSLCTTLPITSLLTVVTAAWISQTRAWFYLFLNFINGIKSCILFCD